MRVLHKFLKWCQEEDLGIVPFFLIVFCGQGATLRDEMPQFCISK